ncbi:hypothetical protein [Paraburkholderia sp. 40]|uniref:hypothetical protein n=1 Tax=Paraburkholderia sp. 40 TaxID=2991059 RepID=UPI003D1A4B01
MKIVEGRFRAACVDEFTWREFETTGRHSHMSILNETQPRFGQAIAEAACPSGKKLNERTARKIPATLPSSQDRHTAHAGFSASA